MTGRDRGRRDRRRQRDRHRPARHRPSRLTARGRGHRRPVGLMGWGTTYVLVCNPDRDAPVWVEKEGITARRWGPRRAEAVRRLCHARGSLEKARIRRRPGVDDGCLPSGRTQERRPAGRRSCPAYLSAEATSRRRGSARGHGRRRRGHGRDPRRRPRPARSKRARRWASFGRRAGGDRTATRR